MLYIPDDKMFPNKFVETQLPTKGQIFDRTGKRAVSPAGVYTGDDPANIGRSNTESAEAFVRSAESFEPPKSEPAPSNEE